MKIKGIDHQRNNVSKASFVSLYINIVGAALALIFPSLCFTEVATALSTTICGSYDVPPGYVAVGYTYDSGCNTSVGNISKNATIIQTPYSGQTICGSYYVPPGYVAVGYTYV